MSLKKEFLDLLEKDREFRYTVAGYLGIREILERLDDIAEEQVKLREEQTRLRQDFNKLYEEQVKLREDFNELRKEQTRLREEVTELRREQVKLRQDFNKLYEEQVKLREEQVKLRQEFNELRKEQIRLREDFNKMMEIVGRMDRRLRRVELTLEKITLDIEEEARSIIKYRLKELGVEMDIVRLMLPDLEINIYGVAGDLCIVGEASVRAGYRVMEKLMKNLRDLRNRYPDKLRRIVVLVVYTSLAMPDLVEEAKKRDIWVLKATGDIVRPKLLDKIKTLA